MQAYGQAHPSWVAELPSVNSNNEHGWFHEKWIRKGLAFQLLQQLLCYFISFCFLTDIYLQKIFYRTVIYMSLCILFFSLTVGPTWVQGLFIFLMHTHTQNWVWILSQYLKKREVKLLNELPQITELFTYRVRGKLENMLWGWLHLLTRKLTESLSRQSSGGVFSDW